ncbi:MAG: hypothetical protein EZS28_013278 [Streblomastix strix]|uniref:Uncharacterized protein n=1 Tax=Streblomastix strix TaxID=222440 RepID=A0A5J4W8H7_9EUKA|nr:MAG: hypothetical protein EZS28_013278 [Streblomastix strix]
MFNHLILEYKRLYSNSFHLLNLHRKTVHLLVPEHEHLPSSETQHFPVHSTKVTQTVQEVNILSSSINSPCQSNISQRGSGYFNIAEALSIPCTESEGYEISLLDPKHVEHLEVNINASILIKGCNTNQTIWSIDSQKNDINNLVQ